jgi:hypothetical protein
MTLATKLSSTLAALILFSLAAACGPTGPGFTSGHVDLGLSDSFAILAKSGM